MKGDPGPYMNDDGDVWVPRTVPWGHARRVALTGVQLDFWQRLRYVGKEDANLLGFTRDCRCDEVCELANRCRSCGSDEQECACATPDQEDWDICSVPAWRYKVVEL